MTNKPILSVELRSLLERAVLELPFCDARHELRELLDKPDDVLPCDVKVAPGTIIRKGCKVSALMACIGARSGLDDKFTQLIEPVAQHQGEPVACIIRSRSLITQANAAIDGKDHFSAWSEWEPSSLEYGQAVTDPDRNDPACYEMKPLYAEQPAPVAVVMPERKSAADYSGYVEPFQAEAAAIYNRALDDVELLNSLSRSKDDLEAGRTVSSDQMKKNLEARFKGR